MAGEFRGTDTIVKGLPFEAGMLPLSERESLCRQLLGEFGVTQVRATPGHELIHSCCLPIGGHANGDRNPSAALNYEKLTYHCYGCGNSGGLLWFIGVCRGDEDVAVRKWLADQTGTGPDDIPLSVLLEFFDNIAAPKQRVMAEPIPKMSPSVLNKWLAIHPYMTEMRRIPEDTLMDFRVGFDPHYKVRVGPGPNDWVDSQRIILPLFWNGDLAGWQARRLINDGTGKYVNSPSFPREQALYNYDERRAVAVAVESPLSVLAMHHRVPIFESTFGGKVTDRQVRLLAAHQKVILWYDNDEAGWKATHRVAEALEPYSAVWVVENPYAADPADFVAKGQIDTALELLSHPIPYAVWSPPKTLVPLEGGEVPCRS